MPVKVINRELDGIQLPVCPPPTYVREFNPSVSSAWDSFVQKHSGGTPFHLTSWLRAVVKTFGFTNRSLYIESEGAITGVLPLFETSSWIAGRCLISSPFAVYGGICSDDPQSARMLVERARELAISAKVDYLELRNFNRQEEAGFSTKDLYATFWTELSPDVEAQLKRLPRDLRYMIRKGEKNGLEVRSGVDQLHTFHRLFSTSMHRLGTPAFPLSWLTNLIDEFQDAIDLTLLYYRGQAVCGVFSFIFQDTISPYYAGSLPLAKEVAANNYIYWAIMKNAIGRRLRRFDFGRSKKGTGAYDFKSGWNMETQTLKYAIYLVKRKDMPNFSPVNPKFELASRLWSKLPLKAATWLGPRLVRCFP